MARIKLSLPAFFPFSTTLLIRITDINYGGHLGNDTVLSLIHEARMQFLGHLGYSELDMDGVSLIMGDVAIEFKNEVFYGDTLTARVAVDDLSRLGFDLYYQLEKTTADGIVPVAFAKTGMICFDYRSRKIASLPEAVRSRFLNL